MKSILVPIFLAIYCPLVAAQNAQVDTFAEPMMSYNPLKDISVYDINQHTNLNPSFDGRMYHFNYPVGQQLDLLFTHKGYKTTQSGTFTVPSKGFTGEHNNISWQAIPSFLWFLVKNIVELDTSTQMNNSDCQVIATVTAYDRTLDDDPQGEPNATVNLQNVKTGETGVGFDKTYYFGILGGKTLPIPGLKETTADGGVIFMNVQPGQYKIIAEKAGVQFSQPEFNCDPTIWKAEGKNELDVINLSPPQGPIVLK
ncbi:carboxypeptidase-like regulatory domain-containing protein [Parashewanella tropica]|uniref:carboxypeptidase-like regulatory domain-containing protein n=1 Tax=Parashewanella tropica TaxID=2547970 RepID=UPI001059C310|nr:carboxypeptidase-like regulatory domain-containing protein [Parashewanella tropica]